MSWKETAGVGQGFGASRGQGVCPMREEALAQAQALAAGEVAECLDHGEMPAGRANIPFSPA